MSVLTTSQPLSIDASSLRVFSSAAANHRQRQTPGALRTIRFFEGPGEAGSLESPASSGAAAAGCVGRAARARRRLWSLSADEAALDVALDRMIDRILSDPQA